VEAVMIFFNERKQIAELKKTIAILEADNKNISNELKREKGDNFRHKWKFIEQKNQAMKAVRDTVFQYLFGGSQTTNLGIVGRLDDLSEQYLDEATAALMKIKSGD
jgi:hypothetical protein